MQTIQASSCLASHKKNPKEEPARSWDGGKGLPEKRWHASDSSGDGPWLPKAELEKLISGVNPQDGRTIEGM